jgi:minor extracellular serine protease Vpr
MKKLYTFLMIAGLSLPALAQQQAEGQPGLSPLTRKYLSELKKPGKGDLLPEGYIYRKGADGKTYISALVRVADEGKAAAKLADIGAHVGTRAGNIWTVQVPVEQVRNFVQLKGIAYIQLDEPVFPMMDVVRRTTRVDSVHKGYDLPLPYSGKDVVVGVLDFGFDYKHPVFFDTSGSTYRVKKVWELDRAGTPPSGYSYGHELTGASVIQAQGTDNPKQTHGTAVAGIAAGSGVGSAADSNRFLGVAYESDIVLVGVRRDSIGEQWMRGSFADFVDGIAYVFNYANSVGKPAVINISWGSQSGAHNGTSLFNQACDNLSGPGRIIVMSAGNEGREQIHLSKTFTPSDTIIRTGLDFNPDIYKRTWVDIWGDTGKSFCARVTLYNGTEGPSTALICTDGAELDTFLIADNGLDTCYVSFIPYASEYNDMPRIIINVFNKSGDTAFVSVSGKDGRIHMWNEYYYYGYVHRYTSAFISGGKPWATQGNTTSTVSDMGSAHSVLLVGAYNSKISWKDINGNTQSYFPLTTGGIAPFSSRGPLTDGRIKPDIAAPGLTLGSAVSSYDTSYTRTGSSSDKVVAEYEDLGSGRKYYYAEFIGTSASGPVAAGIVALMLQANPNLGPADVQQVIRETALRDANTGPLLPNNTWGWGKINAYAAVKRAIQKKDIYSFTGNMVDCVLFPNPGTGRFTLEYTGNKSQTLRVEVLSMTGALVSAQDWQVHNGMNQLQLDITRVPKGVYLVKVAAQDGVTAIRTVVE